jgi:hypothetical protein
MMDRLHDREAIVRMQAVYALSRMQVRLGRYLISDVPLFISLSKTDESAGEIITEFLRLMSKDSRPYV